MELGSISPIGLWNQLHPTTKQAMQNTMVVALAVFWIAKLEWQCNLEESVRSLTPFAVITLMEDSEKFPEDMTNYFEMKGESVSALMHFCSRALLVALIFHYVRGSVLKLTFDHTPKRVWAARFIDPMCLFRYSLKRIICNPIAMEILCRGFIQDRFDEIQTCLSDKTNWVKSPKPGEITIAKVAQWSLCAMDQVNQGFDLFTNVFFFGLAARKAMVLTQMKENYGMLTAMGAHMMMNSFEMAGNILF